MRVHFDFETRCEVDIAKEGLARYTSHPSFEIILTAWAVDDSPIQQCEGVTGFLRFLRELPRQPETFHAFNAPFERACLHRMGYTIPPSKWRCTMVHAYGRGFTGGLEKVGGQVGIRLLERKLVDDGRLVRKFCTPRSAETWWTKENAPDDWDAFLLYNRLDVEAERAIWRILNRWPWTLAEQDLWQLDQEINRNGLPIDLPMVTNAITLAAELAAEANEKCKRLTGGIGASQVTKLMAWCREQGYPAEDLRADTIRAFLAGDYI